MKRKTALLLAMVLMAVGMMTGCGGRVVHNGSATEGEKEETQTAVSLKTGLALTAKVEKSTDAKEEDGLAQTDVSACVVTVDGDGKVVACAIDAVQVKANFNNEGKLTTELNAQFKSKNELGEEYGMKAASTIGKEWNEQAAAFAAYCVGKTSDEIAAITVEDADLAAGCTMHPGNFQWLVVKAIGNAAESGAQPGDKIGLGVSANIEKSKDAGDEDGLAQGYVTVTGVTTNAEGKVTSAVIDAVQANVNFDKTGTITTDLTAEIKTKNELGEAYGMKAASTIGKEWNEQAAAFAAYCVGKTADEITAITANDADLTAGCTMHPGNFQYLVADAVGNAK